MAGTKTSAAVWTGVAIAAGIGFSLVARASANRSSAHIDRAVQHRVRLSRRSRAGKLAESIAPAGKSYVLGPAAFAVSAALLTRRHHLGAPESSVALGTIGACAVMTTAAELLFDEHLPQPPVPEGRKSPREVVFPSGHSFVAVAMGVTCAHVLSREQVVRPDAAYAAALAAAVVNGGAKLLIRKHWLSDIVGGALAGLVVSGASCAAYELARVRD